MIAFLLGVLLGIVFGLASAFLMGLHDMDQWP